MVARTAMGHIQMVDNFQNRQKKRLNPLTWFFIEEVFDSFSDGGEPLKSSKGRTLTGAYDQIFQGKTRNGEAIFQFHLRPMCDPERKTT